MADDGERKPTPLRFSTQPAKGKAKAATTTERRDPSPATTAPHQLLDEQLDPALRLSTVLDMTRRAYEEYQEACALADDFGAGAMPDGTDANDLMDAREKVRNTVRRAYNRWFELSAQARSIENDLRRRKLEMAWSDESEKEYQRLRTDLREEYGGLGPHYELLCDNCARVTVRLQLLESSGRDYDSGEYAELHKLYLSYVNQLQKYTEAMKSESINRQTQDVAERIIQLFERHFGNAYPVEWHEAALELKSLIEGAA